MKKDRELIAGYLNLDGNTEQHVFIQSTGKKTSQMRYDEFIKYATETINPLLKAFLDTEVKGVIEKFTEMHQFQDIKIPSIPDGILEATIVFIDKQDMNLVEKTFCLLDLHRSIAHTIQQNTQTMIRHYVAEIRNKMPKLPKKPTIYGADGGRVNTVD